MKEINLLKILFDSIRILVHKKNIFLILIAISLMFISGSTKVDCTIVKTTQLKFTEPYSNDDGDFKPITTDISDPNGILKFFFNKTHRFGVIKEKNSSVKKNLSSFHVVHDENNEIAKNEMLPKKNIEKISENLNNPLEKHAISEGIKRLQQYLLSYIEDCLSQSTLELFMENKIDDKIDQKVGPQSTITKLLTKESFEIFERLLQQNFENNQQNETTSRAMETGRLFLFKGLKKLLWPLFIGVQIAKSILLALFLPSILGSLGKMVGKGLTQISGFNHPSETVGNLDFKDTTYTLDDDYTYPRPEASTNHFETQAFQGMGGIDVNSIGNALSRFGFGDQKLTYVNSVIGGEQNTISKNSNNLLGNNKNMFKEFLKVPASSLLLSNYDPFYSPLLSRIDSVFAQLGLANGNENCRAKLICLMYSNPAKYAPYSNLVSAQLSRELNELRKPTSDNEEILRFFKYMRAAKDGQDGTNCEKTYETCVEFKDSENPVMITTYNDINKLVEARKLIQ